MWLHMSHHIWAVLLDDRRGSFYCFCDLPWFMVHAFCISFRHMSYLMNALFTAWENYGGRTEPRHSEFFPSRLYYSVVALRTVSEPINNNKKGDSSALNDVIG